MNAIDWMDARAKVIDVNTITVTKDEADNESEIGTFTVTTRAFGGAIPYRMKKEAFKIASSINDTPSRTIRVNGYDKTDVVEYFETTIVRVT